MWARETFQTPSPVRTFKTATTVQSAHTQDSAQSWRRRRFRETTFVQARQTTRPLFPKTAPKLSSSHGWKRELRVEAQSRTGRMLRWFRSKPRQPLTKSKDLKLKYKNAILSVSRPLHLSRLWVFKIWKALRQCKLNRFTNTEGRSQASCQNKEDAFQAKF